MNKRKQWKDDRGKGSIFRQSRWTQGAVSRQSDQFAGTAKNLSGMSIKEIVAEERKHAQKRALFFFLI